MSMRTLPALGLLLGLSAPAASQPSDVAPAQLAPARDFAQLGLGVALNSDYDGSNDYRLIPGGVLRARVSGVSIQTEGLGISADLVDRPGKFDLDVGPAVRVNLNRTGKVRDDLVDLLPERDVAVEAGGFVGLTIRRITNPYDSLSLRVRVLRDVAGAHRSTIVTPSASFATPLSTATLASFGVSADIVPDRYADYYFGVSAADSTASGLRAFAPSGGLKSVGANLLVAHSLSGDLRRGGWGLFALASHSRLRGDFKRSPLVADRGSAGQWFAGTGVGYSW
jgi:outer membrane scaffolding protein for murein synthesis (MipA/OmpV family)